MAEDTQRQNDSAFVYAIINNIPADYHSKDLRNYFSQFIEERGFDCFHFRHRPEAQIEKDASEADENHVQTESKQTSNSSRKGTTCCVVRISADSLLKLIKMYHRKHWIDRNGDSISSFCHITKVKLSNEEPSNSKEREAEQDYKTRLEVKMTPEDRSFTSSHLLNLPELHPPDVMPHGNVGTPTKDFLQYIKECRLPPSLIKKLGLSFPKTRTNRRYGSVPFEYGKYRFRRGREPECWTVFSRDGHELVSVNELIVHERRTSGSVPSEDNQNEKTVTGRQKRKMRKKERAAMKKLMNERIEEKMIKEDDESNEDNDSCEEWERHEATTDDPTNQERNKERLFEEEIELKWEKGGSGLVFYTDAQYWQEKEGDFDEQTADDLNVDFSGYYEDGAGDLDARDYLTLRQEKRRRDGLEETDRFSAGIGKFEKHTKGIGRKVLEKQGWAEGQGLGSTITGIADALDNEGQHPRNKKGFGYHGEKLIQYRVVPGPVKKKKHFVQSETLISTVYDDPEEVDPPEKLLRRNDHYGLKHRQTHS